MKLDDTLIKSLLDPNCYDHATSKISLVETHISWVILTGDLVYKIKKPVNFGFVDFSTLELRKYFCQKELKLNTKNTDGLYLKVVAITGTKDEPKFGGSSKPIEYALVMKQFSQKNLLSRLEATNKLTYKMLLELAWQLAKLHLTDTTMPISQSCGDYTTIKKAANDNFDACKNFLEDKNSYKELDKIKSWTNKFLEDNQSIILKRTEEGFIRNCHGDLHLNNIVLVNDKVTIFDCIEFNEQFSWIDVINDISFITMDLLSKGHPNFSFYLINNYLEVTGDYAGLKLLKFYIVYRAMVRAKVALITNNKNSDLEFKRNLATASDIINMAWPKIIIMNGVSGSGKSFVSEKLAIKLPAIRIRSDVERKRLYSAHGNLGLYSEEMTKITFNHLLQLTETIFRAGFSVIVDATFLQKKFRKPFMELQKKLNTQVVIVAVCTELETIKARIKKREQEATDVSDANLEVLNNQLKSLEELTVSEKDIVVSVNTNINLDIDKIVKEINLIK